jgi:hypothetical protein
MKNKIYLPLAAVALLCVVLWTAYGQGQRSNAARQAWEYKTFVYMVQKAANNLLYEDGKPLPGSATPISRAADLGAEGWELVSIAATESPGTTTYVYWFKRPK